ncbi:alpha/beta fold hydrolase [Corynebacterium sp.]|uniref:alpha/beta fold hydrolase n=1 Tax=Corynebacterium sp. TaxID=1720 RepID=UPI0026DD0068|nr:alpha/beta fold hydrolase [Corynebacterium sp.]MDO5077824.1 alpha/beta fold hydrolase [Corynebacterium sp.]
MVAGIAVQAIAERVREILSGVSGVELNEQDFVLKNSIPHSVTLLHCFLGIEDEFNIQLPVEDIRYDYRFSELVELVRAAVGANINFAKDHSRGHDVQSLHTWADQIPLNQIQLAYLFGASTDFELGGTATYMYVEAEYAVSKERLADCLNSLVARHSAFHYVPDLESGMLVRADLPQVNVEIRDAISDADLREELKGKASRSFVEEPGTMLVVAGETGTKLFAYFNMVGFDAGSIYVFSHELDRLIAGETLPPALQCAEAAAVVTAKKQRFDADEDWQYWKHKLDNFPLRPSSLVPLFGDQAPSMRRVSHQCSVELVNTLHQVASALECSVSALLLGVHTSVVSRWLNQPEFPWNVTVTDRVFLPNQPCLGDFTTSLLIAGRSAAGASLAQTVLAISDDLREGLQHRGVSGVEALQWLQDPAERRLARCPLVFTSYLGGTQHSSPQVTYVASRTAQVALDVQVMPNGDGMVLSWDVAEEYFPAYQRMFALVLQQLEALGNCPIDAISVPAVDPHACQHDREYNATTRDYPDVTLVDLVRSTVERTPDAIALIDVSAAGETVTYGQLWQAAGCIARELEQHGMRVGDRVVVRYTRTIQDILNVLGVVRAGGTYIPVDSQWPEARRQQIMAQAAAFAELFGTSVMYTGAQERGNDDLYQRDVQSRDLAYIIFTSGTTGRPKGVETSHRAVVNTIQSLIQDLQLTSRHVFLGLSALSFDLSVFDVFAAFAVGGQLAIIHDNRDVDEIIACLKHVDAPGKKIVWNSAPALLELLLLRLRPTTVIHGVRVVMLSGDRIGTNAVRNARKHFPEARFLSLGGATEAAIWSISMDIGDDSLDDETPYGFAMPNQSMHVLGYDRQPAPIGVVGDIYIGGVGLADRYCAAPDLTHAAFPTIDGQRRYRTGDRGYVSEFGYICFAGREDNQVKIQGFRVELDEIPQAAKAALVARDCIAMAITRRSGQTMLAAAYVPRTDEIGDVEFQRALSRQLPRYMVPSLLVRFDELPTTANGKLDYPEIRRQCEASLQAPSQGEAAPSFDAQELAVARIWATVLGVPIGALDPDSTFFEAGGDSLKFQEMLVRLRQELGFGASFRDLILHPTIAHITQLLGGPREHELTDTSQVVSPLEVQDYGEDPHAPFPLTDMQMAYFIGRGEGFALGGVSEHYYVETLAHVDLRRLEGALNKLIARHGMLRAVVLADATQRVLPTVPYYRINVTDLRAVDNESQEAELHELRDKLSHQLFDVHTWPLFTLVAARLAENTYRLFFSVDMIIGDGMSQRLFIQELNALYEGAELGELQASFRDYVLADTRRRAHGWIGDIEILDIAQELELYPAGNYLPHLQAAAEVQRVRMQRVSDSLDAATVAGLRRGAAKLGVSVNTLFLGAYMAVLGLWATTERVGVNVTTFNRRVEVGEHRGVFGDFTGLVLLSADARAAQRPDEFLPHLHNLMLKHLAADYAGVKAVTSLAASAGLVGDAVAPFVFTSLLFDAGRDGGGAAETTAENALGEVVFAISQTPQVLIDNQLLQRGDDISVAWDYVADVFPPGMVEAMFARYIVCVRALASTVPGQYPPIEPTLAVQLGKYGGASSAYRRPASPRSTTPPTLAAADGTMLREIVELSSSRCGPGKRVPSDSNLLEQGLDSLGFVQLIRDVEQRYCVQLPLAAALARPTAAHIAELVGSARRENGGARHHYGMQLLRRRYVDSGKTDHYVVCIHGGFGSIDVYSELALHAPEDAEVWGLPYPGLSHNFPQEVELRHLAAEYAELIRQELPTSANVTLIGWSLGGSIAHELAGLLRDEFDLVVALLDSLAPGIQVETALDSAEDGRTLVARVASRLGIASPHTDSPSADWWDELVENCQAVGKEAELVYEIAREISPSLVADLGLAGQAVTVREFNALRSLLAARNRFVPAAHVDSAILVIPQDGEAREDEGWTQYIRTVQTVECEGNHYSMLLGDGAKATANIIWGLGEGSVQ